MMLSASAAVVTTGLTAWMVKQKKLAFPYALMAASSGFFLASTDTVGPGIREFITYAGRTMAAVQL